MTNFKKALILLFSVIVSYNAHAALSDHFVTTWKTDNIGSSNDTSITIFTNSSYTYSYDVDWDNDGVFDEFSITGDVTHDFGVSGIYTIRIKGDFPYIFVSQDKGKILSIDQWGTNPWESMVVSFQGAVNLVNKARDTPNLSNCSSLYRMFSGASLIGAVTENANWNWDTSNINVMAYMFSNASSFNQNIGSWNVENITYFTIVFTTIDGLESMFENVKLSVANYDALLIGWNAQNLPSNRIFDAGESIYCSAAAQAAHDNLTSHFNWTIKDGGLCENSLNIVTKFLVFDENTIQTYPIEYTDPDNDTPSFVLSGGDDMGLFSLDANTRNLSFINPPNFENPLDADGDNVYLVEVTATDNSMPIETDTQLIKVYVNNISENSGSDHFVTTWNTNYISLYTDSWNYIYNYNVDWDNDGVFDEFNIMGDISHSYSETGIHTIRISGDFPQLHLQGNNIVSVDQWGSNPWLTMEDMFRNANNLILKAPDIPNLFRVKSLAGMFHGAISIGSDSNIGNWNWHTPTVVDMNYIFSSTIAFNQDISSWDTSSVTNMGGVFKRAIAFNQDINSWDTSSVTNMEGVFNGAISFNQGIGNWDTNRVTTMAYMFSNANTFNQDLSSWNTRSVETMQNMFEGATSFNQDLSSWNTRSVETMQNMFGGANSFNQDISNWDVENIIDFSGMFENVRLSVANYDALLIGWNAQALSSDENFDAGLSIYCSLNAQTAHENMTSDLNWSINDGGACENSLNILTRSIVFDENTIQTYPIEFSDPDNDTASFALTGGDDMGLFSIDSVSGTISFNNPPDFEGALDADGDNIYLVEVTATDNGSPVETDTQLIKIYVNNINENLASEDFVTTWNTNSITLGISGLYIYNYNVDWDNDGVFDEFNITSYVSHTYSETGTHTIRISGDFPQLSLRSNNIVSVDQWGSNPWKSMESMFRGANNLVIKAQDIPNLFNVTSLHEMFYDASLVGGDTDIGNWSWHTPTINNMHSMFSGATSFNKTIDVWDISNVTDIANTFFLANSFNQPIGDWDTRNARDLSNMFANATSFNQPINSWDTSNVRNISNMFANATSFNQPIGDWDISNVRNISNMFTNATSFNQPIGSWNTSNILDIRSMFENAVSFDQDLGGWNVEKIPNFSDVFKNVKLSIANYDALLIGWSQQNLHPNIFIDFGESIYCLTAAKIAHDNIESMFNWSIKDLGACEDSLNIITKFIVLDENVIQTHQIQYTDPDYDIAQFELSGGDDMGLFSLNDVTGEIAFINAPDYEIPLDVNGDNIYLVEVTVTDNGSPIETDTQLIRIYVNNIYENLASEHFVATWNSDSITIGTDSDYIYNYDVDWDNDGIFDEFNIQNSVYHTYNNAGNHTIRIAGNFPRFFLGNSTIVSVDQWGSNPWESVRSMFSYTDNLIIKAQDTPNLFNLNSLDFMFEQSSSVGNDFDTGNWNWKTPTIKSMLYMFNNATSFNKYLNTWDTHNVTDMRRMFSNATSFNQPIANWDTRNVTKMGGLFLNATSFNQPIGNWDTRNVTDMGGLFLNATSFNQDLSLWDVHQVIYMNGMFQGAISFNQELSLWDTSKVYFMSDMFNGATSFNQNLANWNVENVHDFYYMFTDAGLSVSNYDALLVGWNNQNLTMRMVFDGGTSIYCSQAAQAAHDNMISTFNWTITDGGVCAPQLDIVSSANVTVDENHTTVIKVITTDPDFDTPTFVVSGGADAALFSIDINSGLISFIAPPDFEMPLSSTNSNAYEVEVSAMDNGIPQEFASQLITVNVLDLIETSPIDLSINATANTNVVNLGDTFTYTVTVANIGSENAVNASIYDVLPAEIVHTTWTCVATGTATCSPSGTGEIADIVSVPNDGSTLTYTITATASNQQYLQSSYQIFADSNEPQYDTDLSNNVADVMLLTPLIFKDGFD